MSDNPTSPAQWLDRINAIPDFAKTDWISGDIAPVHRGYYERYFSDGIYMHFFDGQFWFPYQSSLAQRHWRQVGDYPCWRGLVNEFKKKTI